MDAPRGRGDDEALSPENADVWSDDHEVLVEAEGRHLGRWALGWTWALLLVVVVALTALVVRYTVLSLGAMGN